MIKMGGKVVLGIEVERKINLVEEVREVRNEVIEVVEAGAERFLTGGRRINRMKDRKIGQDPGINQKKGERTLKIGRKEVNLWIGKGRGTTEKEVDPGIGRVPARTGSKTDEGQGPILDHVTIKNRKTEDPGRDHSPEIENEKTRNHSVVENPGPNLKK